MKNWKTNLAAILVVAVVAAQKFNLIDANTAITLIGLFGGGGLFASKDFNRSGTK